MTTEPPPPGFVARAGTLCFVAEHVVESALPEQGVADAAQTARFFVYDRDGKTKTESKVPLPAACTEELPPLVQCDNGRVFALLRCPKEQRSILLHLDAEARLKKSRVLSEAAAAELLLHQPDADYVLAGRQVMRVGADDTALPTIGTVPPPDGDADTRELVRAGDLLLVIDGAAGRLIAMDAQRMGWRFEKHFPTGRARGKKGAPALGQVTRVRAALGAGDRLYVVTAETGKEGQELFGVAVPLDEKSLGSARLRLGVVPSGARSDHELVPISKSAAGGALLVYSHLGNSGPLVALRKLTF
jgi:hypothetical protein